MRAEGRAREALRSLDHVLAAALALRALRGGGGGGAWGRSLPGAVAAPGPQPAAERGQAAETREPFAFPGSHFYMRR